MNKVDVKKIAEEATEKAVEKIKEVSFKQSIQPLVESELKKIMEQVQENATKIASEELDKLQVKYDNLLSILENFAKYFDDAIAITAEKKEALHTAINNSKQLAVDTTLISQVVEPVEKQTIKVDKSKKVSISVIER